MAKQISLQDPLLLAVLLKIIAVDGPVPGIDPMGPLFTAGLRAQLLNSLAGSLSNKTHQTALQKISREIMADATQVVSH